MADPGALAAPARAPPGVHGVGGHSGTPTRPPDAVSDREVPPRLGETPRGTPQGSGTAEETPSPVRPIGSGAALGTTTTGFVPPGSDAPTEVWKQAMVEAVQGILTPLNERLSFLEDSSRKMRRKVRRRPDDSSSESTSDYSAGDGRRRRLRPRPVVRALGARPVPVRVAQRAIPPKIVPSDGRFTAILDCETYALVNTDTRYTEAEAHGLGKERKDLAATLGRDCEWDGTPSLRVFEFLGRFVKAANDNNLSEGRALYLLPEFTKDPLKRHLYRILPSIHDGGRMGEVRSYLEMVNWLLRRYADENLLSEQDEAFNTASQAEDGELEDEFYERLMALHAKCGYIQNPSQVRARYVQALRWEIRTDVRDYVSTHPDTPIEMIVQYARRRGDQWRRLDAARQEEKAKEAAERLARRAARRTFAATVPAPHEAGEVSRAPPGPPAMSARPAPGAGTAKADRKQKYPCAACNSMQHWTRECPALPETVRTQMTRARAQRLAAREAARQRSPTGAVAAVTTTPKGGDAETSPKGGVDSDSPFEESSSSGN